MATDKKTYQHEWYVANRERILANRREYYSEHRQEIEAYKVSWRERTKEARKAYDQSYYVTHRELLRQRMRAYNEEHAEELAEYRREYRLHHPEKDRDHRMRRRALLAETSVAGDRKRMLSFIKNMHDADRVRCYLCGELVPRGKRTVDHIIPLSKAGSHSVENVACACASCNNRKSAKMPEEVGVLL